MSAYVQVYYIRKRKRTTYTYADAGPEQLPKTSKYVEKDRFSCGLSKSVCLNNHYILISSDFPTYHSLHSMQVL